MCKVVGYYTYNLNIIVSATRTVASNSWIIMGFIFNDGKVYSGCFISYTYLA